MDIVTTSFAPNQLSNLCCNIGCGFIYVKLKKLNHKCISQLDKNTPIFEKGGAHCFAHVCWLSFSNNIKLNKCPLPFKALKGAAVKLLACRQGGPGINPGLDRSNSVIVYLLFYFFVLFSLAEKMELGGRWCYKCPLPKHLANDICHSTYIVKSDGKNKLILSWSYPSVSGCQWNVP